MQVVDLGNVICQDNIFVKGTGRPAGISGPRDRAAAGSDQSWECLRPDAGNPQGLGPSLVGGRRIYVLVTPVVTDLELIDQRGTDGENIAQGVVMQIDRLRQPETETCIVEYPAGFGEEDIVAASDLPEFIPDVADEYLLPA